MSRKKIALVAVIVVVAVGGYGLNELRKSVGGLRNMLSRSYWAERQAGTDLYNPDSRYLKRGRRDRHELLLTIDDSPKASCASMMATLKKYDVPATFFVIGRRVKEHPELVREMIADGFEVGNHTQDHLRLDTLTPKQVDNEIKNCATNVMRATGRGMTLLRPPGMRITPDVNRAINKLGYTVVGWNVGAKDFIPDQQVTDMTAEQSANMKVTPDEIVDRVMKQVQDGTIILLHDNPVTAQALPTILEKLLAQGYVFRSTAEFLAELPHPVTVVANPPSTLVTLKSGAMTPPGKVR